MAKQVGQIRVTGTVDNLCFYKMEGQYYVRMKSSLTRKRFKKDKAFEGSRKSASRFAEGNRLASAAYRKIDKDKRQYALFCTLKRMSILLLKEGKDLQEVEILLLRYLQDCGVMPAPLVKAADERKAIKHKFIDHKGEPVVFAIPFTRHSSHSPPARQTRIRTRTRIGPD